MKKTLLLMAAFLGVTLSAGICEFGAPLKIKVAEYGGEVALAEGTELFNGINYDVETVKLEAAGKKTTYCGIEVRFAKPQDFSDFTSIELLAKAEKSTPVMLTLLTDKGILSAQFRKKPLSSAMECITFERAEFKGNHETDYKKIYGFIIGFGLWNYNAAATGQTIAFGDVRIVTPDSRFIVPRPTAAVAIDGGFRKDWGFENNLYIWKAPVFFL